EQPTMSDKVLYLGSMTFGGLALLLLIANVCFINGNRNLQTEFAQRQDLISKAGTLNQLNQGLIQALGQASLNNQDKAAGDLLSSQGITVSKTKPPAAAPAADNADKKK